MTVTDDQVEDAMKYMDKDGSGAVSFQEFLGWYDGKWQGLRLAC